MSQVDLSERTILLVDDVEFSRTIVAHMLDGLGKPKILKAADGLQATQVLRQHPEVDVVISDFNMPVMNGLGLLKRIRSGEAGRNPALPFAMLTGYSDKKLVDIALLLDVNAFIVKPVSQDSIAKRLKTIFEGIDARKGPVEVRDYSNVAVSDTGELELSVDTSIESVVHDEISLWEKEGERFVRELNGPAADASASASPLPNLTGEELMKWRVQKTAEISGAVPFLKTIFDSDLGRSIIKNIDNLLMTTGHDNAKSVVNNLSALVDKGEIQPVDFRSIIEASNAAPPAAASPAAASTPHGSGPRANAGTLRSEITAASEKAKSRAVKESFLAIAEIPTDSRLRKDLHNAAGEMVLTAGSVLSPQTLSVLAQMAQMDLLRLERRSGKDGLLVIHDATVTPKLMTPQQQQDATIGRQRYDNERMMDVALVKIGDTITRDVYSDTGTLFIGHGTKMSGRMTSLLRDLADLRRIPDKVWVVKD